MGTRNTGWSLFEGSLAFREDTGPFLLARIAERFAASQGEIERTREGMKVGIPPLESKFVPHWILNEALMDRLEIRCEASGKLSYRLQYWTPFQILFHALVLGFFVFGSSTHDLRWFLALICAEAIPVLMTGLTFRSAERKIQKAAGRVALDHLARCEA